MPEPFTPAASNLVFFNNVASCLDRMRQLEPRRLASAHEGYAALLESLDEFWDECKYEKRDPQAMHRRLICLAAIAQRTLEDIVTPMLQQTGGAPGVKFVRPKG